MEKQTAEALAKKGLAFIKSAAKSGAAAISQSVATVRKGYATKHEADVLSDMKAEGLHPAEHLHAALRKLNFLYLSGYRHELQAVAQQAAKRLTDMDRSTVPLDALLCMGGAIYEESLKYSDFNQGKLFHGLQDFLNKSRMGSNHFDRDKLSHDLYYSTLYMVEEYEGDFNALEKICREVVAHVITTAPAPDITSQPKPNGSGDGPQRDAAKACFYYSMALNTAAQVREDNRLKVLREAEALVQREQEKSGGTNRHFIHAALWGPTFFFFWSVTNVLCGLLFTSCTNITKASFSRISTIIIVQIVAFLLQRF